MAINLELPAKLEAVIDMAHKGAAEILRPISRKYDLNEHAYPVELDTIAALFEGMTAAKTISFAGTDAFRAAGDGPKTNVNGATLEVAQKHAARLEREYGPCRVGRVIFEDHPAFKED